MTGTKRQDSFFDRLKHGLENGIHFAKSETELRTVTVVLSEPAPEMAPDEVVRIREQLNMSQPHFARTLNVSSKTVQSWESGERNPSPPARRLLQLIRSNPQLIAGTAMDSWEKKKKSVSRGNRASGNNKRNDRTPIRQGS
ncbi:MAG TPA: helix-turn-helix domain-containing protein [bacterium]|nr:helix-turn-helix domain-containing protein [bacterium]